ncbi:DddA-like double-stranded DNA deaminase toxin [Actinoplanes sp. NPDC049316]|uniref:DddA-like double-stranded DNA deaminase toxin n=1 Tax=Actinoplanes sp. NPDC049316 TaxID=3154727 RepID=UPI003443ADBD
MSIASEVAAQIRAALAALAEARAGIASAGRTLSHAQDRLRAVAVSAERPEIHASASALAGAATAASEASDTIAAAIERYQGYGSQLGFHLGEGPADGSRPSSDSGEADGRNGSRPPPAGPRLQELAERLPPRQPRDPTEGFLVAPGGASHPVSSGRRPANLEGLKRRFRPVSVDHAEGQAAALLRRSWIKEASLVINNEPCQGPYGCDVSLPKMMPPGKVLHVYVRYGGGDLRPYRTYRGTGEGIER